MKTVRRRRRKCRLPVLVVCVSVGSSFHLLQYHNKEPSISTQQENEIPELTTSRKISQGPNVDLLFGTFGLTSYNHTYGYRHSSRMKPRALQMSREGQKKVSSPSIVFGILSAPGNVQSRQAIRDSWGKEETLFFVVAGEFTVDIHSELATFDDVVFLEAPEDYRSGLTRKTMLIIHLYHHLYNTECRQLEEDDTVSHGSGSPCYDYLFKTDDDSYVNTTQLRLELSGKDPKTHAPIEFYGEPSVKTEPDRDPSSRFYMSHLEYPNKYYPPYAFGMGYALSSRLAACVCHQMTQVRKQLPWEDVATGSLVKKCRGKLTWANWSLPGFPDKFQVQYFAYDILKPGGWSVTLVHGVKNPSYMSLLHQQLPLP